jgi:hypothetical protein
MHMTNSRSRLSSILGRTAAVTFLTAAGTLGLHAQRSAGTAPSLPPIDFKASLSAPINLSAPADLNYSSSVGVEETASAEGYTLSSDSMQPPPRRRYGRPNYSDSHTNTDGSARYNFYVGGGFTLPVGDSHSYLAPSYNIQAGVGRNFNKTFGVNAEFDYSNFGFQTRTLNNLLSIYDSLGAVDQNGNPLTVLGGNSHIWSFTLDPIMNYYTSDTWGAYVTGGGGFYHKTANFTFPGVGTYCDFFGFCYQFQANQTIDKYTSNAFGVNGGLGFTYKASRFSSIRFYAEGRYVYTFNSARTASFGDINGNGFNVFPENSHKTAYIPITFGVRF